MDGEGPSLLRPAEAGNPVDVLWAALPAEWRGPVIGPGIADWEKFSEGRSRRLDLTGLPEQIARELAWMAHWQAGERTRPPGVAHEQKADNPRPAPARHPPVARPIPDLAL